MRQFFLITMKITPYDLNILLKSLEHFRNCSNFFENGEYLVGAEDLENIILKSVKGVTKEEAQIN